MKPIFSYYGGKQNMLKDILPLIPEHRVYVEPFIGGGAVFFGKTPAKVEVINDTNGEIVNFYKVIKTKFKQFERELRGTLSSRLLHRKAFIIYQYPNLFDEVQRAWALWVLANMSLGASFNGTWMYDMTKNSSVKRINNKKLSFTKVYAERLEQTQIECDDALKVIQSRDAKDAFHYCDPPYFNAEMGHYKGYTEQDFINLLEVLSKVKGKFLLSSYPSETLNKYIKEHGWFSKEFDKKLCMSAFPNVKKKRKIEVLTGNYEI